MFNVFFRVRVGSLIICEGVSSVISMQTGEETFPHYM